MLKFIRCTKLPHSDGVHCVKALVQFDGCNWATVKVLEESGRPHWAGDPMECHGSVAPFALTNARLMALLGFMPAEEPKP